MYLSVIDLGRVSFKEAFWRQIQLHREILEDDACRSHTIILCEHPHTITTGKKVNAENLLDYKFIKDNNVDFVVGINRGGDITYHGPGQLMGYLIFDLRKLNRNLGGFLNKIEDVIIKTITAFNISTYTKSGFRGIWVNEQKIASIGIGVDRWVSLHGFGLNVSTDLSFFDIIKPCGMDIKMTSMKEQLARQVDINLVKEELVRQVCDIFKLESSREHAFV
ncbi:MAG: lipoyl(octanoyl) transferase LipB [Candidatus Omnitrophica bacterium]|nr:lipoyl(octanoyl) transferase LipB [Candidatus Omnitrophota bacterium]MDD5352237.1 lipoyl(octanoyl) transferase LipB [Candidatus Omnitrophota bacterium]MDD5549835.1 lipoyl(octanoyl) transferase LipB [Candidatus Omnitrophota bacterium]